jgi:hypothetical protein
VPGRKNARRLPQRPGPLTERDGERVGLHAARLPGDQEVALLPREGATRVGATDRGAQRSDRYAPVDRGATGGPPGTGHKLPRREGGGLPVAGGGGGRLRPSRDMRIQLLSHSPHTAKRTR